MSAEAQERLHIMAIDCCPHILEALSRVTDARVTTVASRDKPLPDESEHDIDLIVIGIMQTPLRRAYISPLRSVYPQVPMLVLRREEGGAEGVRADIRGEFVLSDRGRVDDCRIVNQLRTVLPLAPCPHAEKRPNYDAVREVIKAICERHADPDLDVTKVAGEVKMSPLRLSRMLNKEVGVSFRQLLRHIRIEKAKKLLASGRYTVKEVAAQVGFSDSHYFSRSFKELTGSSASEYRSQDTIFG